MSTATATRAPKVTAVILKALIAQRGGYLVQDAAGTVYALPFLTDAQADDPDLLVLLEYADAAVQIRDAGGETAAAGAITASLANQHARGLL